MFEMTFFDAGHTSHLGRRSRNLDSWTNRPSGEDVCQRRHAVRYLFGPGRDIGRPVAELIGRGGLFLDRSGDRGLVLTHLANRVDDRRHGLRRAS